MAMGPDIGGFICFTGVKFLGYSAYAHFLRTRLFDDADHGGLARTFKVGGTRTLIGLAAGLSYGALALYSHFFDRGSGGLIYVVDCVQKNHGITK